MKKNIQKLVESIILDKGAGFEYCYVPNLGIYLISQGAYYLHAVINKPDAENIAKIENSFNCSRVMEKVETIDSTEIHRLLSELKKISTSKYKYVLIENNMCKFSKLDMKNRVSAHVPIGEVETAITTRISANANYLKELPKGYTFDLFSDGNYYLFKNHAENYAFLLAGVHRK
jgi:hypothetical protein